MVQNQAAGPSSTHVDRSSVVSPSTRRDAERWNCPTVSRQDLRFCSVDDVEEAAKCLLSDGNGAGTLQDYMIQMLERNTFQDVLSETQPEVMRAAVRAVQQSQRRCEEAPSGHNAAPVSVLRSVGNLLFRQPLWRAHVLPHLDASLFDDLRLGEYNVRHR